MQIGYLIYGLGVREEVSHLGVFESRLETHGIWDESEFVDRSQCIEWRGDCSSLTRFVSPRPRKWEKLLLPLNVTVW